MSLCGNAPPPPDYSAIANASKESAEIAGKTAADQLQWAKDQYAQSSGQAKDMYKQYMDFLTTQQTKNDTYQQNVLDQQTRTNDMQDTVNKDALARAKVNDANAATDRAYYMQTYRPLEQQAIDDIKNVTSEGYKDNQRGRAVSGVTQQFDAQRDNATQQLESYGIDPSSTRYAALDMGMRTTQAAATAAAANNSDLQVDAQGRAMRSDAINTGKGYPSSIAASYATANQSGAGAQAGINSGNATSQGAASTGYAGGSATGSLYGGATNMYNAGTNAGGTYGNLMGTGPQWAGIGNQSITNWGNTLNNSYQNQMANFNASGGGLGALLGFAGAIPGLAEGGMVDGCAEGGIPANVSGPPAGIPAGAAGPGGPSGVGRTVPLSASPSRGAITDDVSARLEPGEFVVPQDVVRWKGEEFFQKTINTARQAKQGATAKPQARPAIQGPPAFVTARPNQMGAGGGIPMR